MMAVLDAAGPWVVDTQELGRRPGSLRTLERTIITPDDIGTDVIAVAAGQPVEIEGRLESVVEGVLVSGSARATATGECVRCLDEVSAEVAVHFQELFAYPDRAAHHREVEDDDESDPQRVLQDQYMDLEDVVRDAVVTALPFQPVCREDCPGLCSECGAHLADDPDHHHDVIDPRWSALASLAASDQHDDSNETRN